MAYFDKEFKFDKEENYEPLLTALEKADAKALNFLTYRPNQGIRKNGDEYTIFINAPNVKRDVVFKNGVTFDDSLSPELVAKSTFTVDGDVFTQVMDFGPKGKVTFKREYSADSLKVTVTTSIWDGAAVRYYVPV